MKNIIKKNYIFIISFFILLIVLSFGLFGVLREDRLTKEGNAETREQCLSGALGNDEEILKLCEKILKNDDVTADFYSIFSETMIFGFGGILSLSIFLFVSIPALSYVCKYLKNKSILNEATRSNYKNLIKRIFGQAYKSVWIIPCIVLIAFILCFCYTRSFNANFSISTSATIWDESTLNRPFVFIMLYMLNVFIHSILYINISLCVARKHHNYFVAIILSFLIFVGIEAFLEIAINGILLFSIFNTEIGMIFNIMNMFAFNEAYGIITPLIVPFVATIVSAFVVYFMYKNKEKLIIDCEKNE